MAISLRSSHLVQQFLLFFETCIKLAEESCFLVHEIIQNLLARFGKLHTHVFELVGPLCLLLTFFLSFNPFSISSSTVEISALAADVSAIAADICAFKSDICAFAADISAFVAVASLMYSENLCWRSRSFSSEALNFSTWKNEWKAKNLENK